MKKNIMKYVPDGENQIGFTMKEIDMDSIEKKSLEYYNNLLQLIRCNIINTSIINTHTVLDQLCKDYNISEKVFNIADETLTVKELVDIVVKLVIAMDMDDKNILEIIKNN
jgi:hypothetical protein